jgi:hypothetical protein
VNVTERTIVTVELVIALLGCWSFVVLYTRTWAWWRNDVGRHLVAFSSALGLLLAFYVLRLVWRDMPGTGLITVILMTLLTVVILWRLLLFIRIKRDVQRDRTDGKKVE